MKKIWSLVFCLLLCVTVIAGCGQQATPAKPATPTPATAPEPPTKYPEKAIEVVVPFAAGGGTALTATIFSQIMMEEKISPVNMNVVYKPGGSSAVGMSYTAGKKKDPYYMLLVTPAFLTTPLAGDVAVSLDDFVGICILGVDSNMLVAPANSPFNDFADVIAYLKKNPNATITCGGAASGGANHAFAELVFSTAGIPYKYVPFSGGAEGVTAVMGGHLDMTVSKPTECGNFVKAGQLKVLGIGDANRTTLFPEAKTFVEQGVNVVEGMFRGIVAPKGIPEADRAEMVKMFRKLIETERWKKEFVEKYDFTSVPLYGDDAHKYLEESRDRYIKLLKQLNMYKGK